MLLFTTAAAPVEGGDGGEDNGGRRDADKVAGFAGIRLVAAFGVFKRGSDLEALLGGEEVGGGEGCSSFRRLAAGTGRRENGGSVGGWFRLLERQMANCW